MNKQKKPLYYYYFVILLIFVLINTFVLPLFSTKIESVAYNRFMRDAEEEKIDTVEIGDTSIRYTLKEDDEIIVIQRLFLFIHK